MMIESPNIATEMTGWFDDIAENAAFRLAFGKDRNGITQLRWHRDWEDGSETFITEPNTSIWRRLGVSLMRLLPIEPLL